MGHDVEEANPVLWQRRFTRRIPKLPPRSIAVGKRSLGGDPWWRKSRKGLLLERLDSIFETLAESGHISLMG